MTKPITPENKPGQRRLQPTIGLLMTDIEPDWGWLPWQGVIDTARQRDCNAICFVGGELNFGMRQPCNILCDLAGPDTLDGLLVSISISTTTLNETAGAFYRRYHPLPVVGLEISHPGFPRVLQDDYQAMRQAIIHLIEGHGLRRIAFWVTWPSALHQARCQAYLDTLAHYGLPFEPDFVLQRKWAESPTLNDQDIAWLQNLRQRGVQAIVSSSDEGVLALIKIFQEWGVRVPTDIALVGYDDYTESWATSPPLTTVRPQFHEMGSRGAELLLAQITGAAAPEQVTLTGQLITRRSCGCLSSAITRAAAPSVAGESPDLEAALPARRDEIISQMMQVGGLTNTDQARLGRLLDVFAAEIVDKITPGAFINTLDEIIGQVNADLEADTAAWQEVVSALRGQLLPYLPGDRLARAENLWQQARVLLGEAMAQVQAYRSVRAEQRAQLLREISALLITTFEVDKLMDNLAENLPRLGIPSCYLALYENPQPYRYPQPPPPWSRLRLAYTEQGRVDLGAAGRRFPSRQLAPAELWPVGRRGDFIVGALHFQAEQLGFIVFEVGPREGMIYEALRGQISSALKGALLVEQEEKRTRQLQTVAEVSTAVSTILDTSELLQNVVDLTKASFNLYHAHIYLLNEAGDTLQLTAGAGEVGRQMVAQGWQIPLQAEKSLVARAARMRCGDIVNDVRADPNWLSNSLLPETRAELAVPLVSGDQLLGVLDVQADRVNAFSQDDIQIQTTLAGQIAAALQNARLYQQLEEQTAEAEEARETAEQSQKAAEVASRAKSEFLANMSHEFRTPLNGILGYAQILKRDRALTTLQADGVNIIQESGQHLLTLVNDVLDLAKIEARHLELYPTGFNLPSMLQGIAGIGRVQAERKALAFVYDAPPALPKTLFGDEKRLRQVILNLVSNAVKFTEQGQVTLRVTGSQQTVDSRQAMTENAPHLPSTDYRLRFEVADTGVGIPPEIQEKIFLPFEQASGTAQKVEGTGLGLTISRQLVEMMGGQLQVESKVGQGSTFWFEVALPLSASETSGAQAQTRPITGYSGPRRKVLIADDKSYNRSVMVNLLSPLGFECDVAVDGGEAVEKARQMKPDVIVMDLVMPVKTGFEAAQEIRQTPALKDIFIIASSASVFDTHRQQSVVAGCNVFLPKPVDANQLFALLQTNLNLEWVYEEQPAQAGVKSAAPMNESQLTPPPLEELAALAQLATIGDMRGIRQRADQIEQLGEQFKPFAAKLHQLAKEFEVDQILKLVKQYQGEHQ